MISHSPFPPPSARQPSVCCLSLRLYYSALFHTNGIAQHVPFCACFVTPKVRLATADRPTLAPQGRRW